MSLPLGKSPQQQQDNFGRAKARVLFAVLGLALAMGVFVPHGARASISFVQGNSVYNVASAGSIALAFSSNVTAGNLIVVQCEGATNVTMSITDSLGNTYTPIGTKVSQSTSDSELFYAKNITGGANTVTCTYNPTAIGRYIAFHEYSGADKTSPLDVWAFGHNGGTSMDSGATTTKFASEVLAAFGYCFTTCTTPGTNFTQRLLISGDMTEDMIATSTGSYSATMTQSPSDNWLLLMAAFIPASPGIQVSSRSDTLSYSVPSATSNHTIAFTVNNSVVGSSVSNSRTIIIGVDSRFTFPPNLD